MIKIAENVVLLMTVSRAWRLSVGFNRCRFRACAIQFKVGSYLKCRTSSAGLTPAYYFTRNSYDPWGSAKN
jgi:hypothetical protein